MSYMWGLEKGLIQTVNLVVERMVDSWFHLHDLEKWFERANVEFKQVCLGICLKACTWVSFMGFYGTCLVLNARNKIV